MRGGLWVVLWGTATPWPCKWGQRDDEGGLGHLQHSFHQDECVEG